MSCSQVARRSLKAGKNGIGRSRMGLGSITEAERRQPVQVLFDTGNAFLALGEHHAIR